MAHSKLNSWKDCTNSKNVEKVARENGVNIRHTKGSHFVMEKNGQTMTAYDGEISTGVAVKVFKFFVKLGLGCVFLFVLIQNFM